MPNKHILSDETMEIVRVECPNCKSKLDVNNKLNVDKKVIRCPNCGFQLLVHFHSRKGDSYINDVEEISSHQCDGSELMSIYYFGEFKGGYTQYPNDSTSRIFKTIYSNIKAKTQLIIHREGSIIYYCYIRKIDSKKYIGVCVVLSGRMFIDFLRLFSVFEQFVEDVVVSGKIMRFNKSGDIVTDLIHFSDIKEELLLQSDKLKKGLSPLLTLARELPPLNYSVAGDSEESFSFSDSHEELLKASYTFGYTYIYKNLDFNTINIKRYQSLLWSLNGNCENLKKENVRLKSQNTQLRNKQRNTLWVGLLSVVVAVLCVILYFKVLNPSEVTHYETGEFIYYGPLKDKQPNGIGIAIYPDDDEYQRKYYIGNFVNGERQDSAAMLYYDNGDYFYGSMSGDEWEKGVFYNNSDGSNFEGTFKNNEPYTGSWYDHKLLYNLEEGKQVNSK